MQGLYSENWKKEKKGQAVKRGCDLGAKGLYRNHIKDNNHVWGKTCYSPPTLGKEGGGPGRAQIAEGGIERKEGREQYVEG